MFLKIKNTKFLVSLLLAAWVSVFSFCGFGAFIPALLGVPHHASDMTASQCEEACLARGMANHDAAIGISVETPRHPELKSILLVANILPPGLDRLSHRLASKPFIPHSSSTKRYQFLSTYLL